MQRIQIGATHVLTGDRTAAALFEYAGVLAGANLTDTVLIPTVDLRGVAGSFSLRIDAAEPFFAIPVLSQGRDPVDQALLLEMRARICRIHPGYYEDPLSDANAVGNYDEILDLL